MQLFKITTPTESTQFVEFNEEEVPQGLTLIKDTLTSENYGENKYIIAIKNKLVTKGGIIDEISIQLQNSNDEIPLVVTFKGDLHLHYTEIEVSLQILTGHEGKYGTICFLSLV